jgi:carbamoyltransferase
MYYLGISAGFHDAAVSVIDSIGNIKFASHSERYSNIKHDKNLCASIVSDAVELCDNFQVHYYERPWLKSIRQLYSGESVTGISVRNILGEDIDNLLGNPKYHTHSHHLSHAAAGFQTSPFNSATVVIIDAIGEWDTATIWNASYDKNGCAIYKKLYTLKYPDSIGLFYTAMTKRVGLRPLDEEYILMGMAGWGSPKHTSEMQDTLVFADILKFKDNLHLGVPDSFLLKADNMDIAASTQVLLESMLCKILQISIELSDNNNIVFGGGVALNCSANRLIGKYYNNIWIMPNPGDAGSSLGAAALGYQKRIKWDNAYLGYEISGSYPIDNLLSELHTNKIVGVASGKAEFGPRALGNRSLLADPRGDAIKDAVNEIKRRQKFRPFAPVILEELVHDYFDMPVSWDTCRYMQVIARCKFPDLYPAITHIDGTSRVQTVPKDNSGIRQLLEKWYSLTGCPMLLNTSLNIRGEPMVNTIADAKRFEALYGIRVCS